MRVDRFIFGKDGLDGEARASRKQLITLHLGDMQGVGSSGSGNETELDNDCGRVGSPLDFIANNNQPCSDHCSMSAGTFPSQ
jgi:hypothetical protein